MCVLQKARLARIRMAKNATGNAFLTSKKKAEDMLLAREMGLDTTNCNNEDVFALQHHHMLMCLENATVRTTKNFYIMLC